MTSVHKHITGFTQSSMVLVQGELINLERLEAAFEGLHTTSPSGAIFASIDRARGLLQDRGEELLGNAIRIAADARARHTRYRGWVWWGVRSPGAVRPC